MSALLGPKVACVRKRAASLVLAGAASVEPGRAAAAGARGFCTAAGAAVAAVAAHPDEAMAASATPAASPLQDSRSAAMERACSGRRRASDAGTVAFGMHALLEGFQSFWPGAAYVPLLIL